MKNLTKIFKALANEKRLLILKEIINNDKLSLEKISSRINLSYRSTSKHLLLLKGVDLVQREAKAARVFYSIPHFKDDDVKVALLRIIKQTE